jgi:PHD/YefM family antitoxin component YafN of YafNO toxin-antitoxin module
MKDINGAAFRKRLSQHMDECEESNEPLRVTTLKRGRGGDSYQRMVIISEAQYLMMIEQINEGKS